MCCAPCGVCALSRTPGLIKAADCSLPSHLWETSGSHPGLTGTAGVGGFLLPPLSRDPQAPVAAPSPGPACFLPRRARSPPSKWNSANAHSSIPHLCRASRCLRLFGTPLRLSISLPGCLFAVWKALAVQVRPPGIDHAGFSHPSWLESLGGLRSRTSRPPEPVPPGLSSTSGAKTDCWIESFIFTVQREELVRL